MFEPRDSEIKNIVEQPSCNINTRKLFEEERRDVSYFILGSAVNWFQLFTHSHLLCVKGKSFI